MINAASHYRRHRFPIEIISGGMGEVYLAQDTPWAARWPGPLAS